MSCQGNSSATEAGAAATEAVNALCAASQPLMKARSAGLNGAFSGRIGARLVM